MKRICAQYQQRVEAGELPIHRGHVLDGEDQVLRRHILRLMTRLETRWDAPADYTDYLATMPQRLAEPAADGLVELEARRLPRDRRRAAHSCAISAWRSMRAWRAACPTRALFSRTL